MTGFMLVIRLGNNESTPYMINTSLIKSIYPIRGGTRCMLTFIDGDYWIISDGFDKNKGRLLQSYKTQGNPYD